MTGASSASLGGPGEPYGGALVDTTVPASEKEDRMREARRLTGFRPFIDFIYDAEKIGTGAYSPLRGFMDEEQLESVVRSGRLPSGLPWTIPIILAAGEEELSGQLRNVKEGDDIALLDWTDSPFAVLHLKQKFRYSKGLFASYVYGTTDTNHPNVFDIYNNYGETALSGEVTLLRRLDLPVWKHELTPAETRRRFKELNWNHIVAYQCRNPPHTAHEYLQRTSLESADIDGLFIQPVVGRLKKGDYKPEVIMDAYSAVVEKYYPKNRVMLGSISITMRYGGPKASLFLAIVRKNYGATHYIVGRDQAGVGNYYDPYACHRIFDEFEIGITPLKYAETFFCRVCGWMATDKTCPHPASDRVSTSQTKIRQLLKEGAQLPHEILRPEVAEILRRGNVILEE